jgi:hypothetical protein
MDLGEICWEVVVWVHLDQDRVQWWASGSKNGAEFFE